MTQISKKWTTVDVQFLVDNYLTMTDQEIGSYLGKTKDAVERKIERSLVIQFTKFGSLTLMLIF